MNTVHFTAGRVEEPSFGHIPSASRPTSPDTQLQGAVQGAGQGAGLTKEQAEIYHKYLQEEIKEENIERLGKEQLDRIKYYIL